MLNDRITKAEIKQAVTEVTLAVHLMMASAELINKGTGEMVLDMLLEELEGLRPKGSLPQSPAVTAPLGRGGLSGAADQEGDAEPADGRQE